MVPRLPSSASAMQGSEVMAAGRPVRRTKRQAAATFGPMLPLANSSRSASASISARLTSPSGRASAVPQPATAFSTSVAMISRSATSSAASSAAVLPALAVGDHPLGLVAGQVAPDGLAGTGRTGIVGRDPGA